MNIKPLTNPHMKYRIKQAGIIEGYWNEDNNPFEIKCPVQLQAMLLEVLNNLEINKIKIRPSKTADTRSAEKKVTKEELLQSSKQHISDVQKAIGWMMSFLRDVSEKHDYTKITNIDEFFNNFKFIQDGNVADFLELNWYKNIHLQERHHLDNRCPEDVNLFDVLERVADITTAGMARTGKVYDDSLSPEILEKAYKNTITLLLKNIEVNK